MTLNDAYYTRYSILHECEHQQDKNKTDRLKEVSMDDAKFEELTYSLLQANGDLWKRAAYHLLPQKNLQYVFHRNGGIIQRFDIDRQFNNIRWKQHEQYNQKDQQRI